MPDDPGQSGGSLWDKLNGVPSMDDDPVVWDPRQGAFVPRSSLSGAAAPAPPAAPPPAPPAPSLPADATAVLRTPPRPTPRGPRAVVGPPPGSPPPRPPQGPPQGPPPGAPRRAAPGGPRPAPPRRPRPRRRHPWVFRIGMVLLPLVVIAVGVLGLMWWQFSKIERVDVSEALVAGSGGTNYLIVGTDSREGIDPDDPNAGAFLGEEVDGQRTDTIMLLRTQGDQSFLMSIPRDLWVTNPATGEPGRINATFRSGPANLITAVEGLGVPVDHYMEINFVSFGELVDALGGITVDIPYPARDTHSGLDLPQAGPQTLTGGQALAYVRSRFYEELIDGQWVAEGTGDLGRVTRQQQFLQGLLSKAGSVRNPLTAKDMIGALSVGLRIDDTISFVDAMKLGWTFGHLDLETVELPTTPRTTSGGAQVLDLAEPDASVALSQMGSSGAAPVEPGGG